MATQPRPAALLWDLDGTLVDSDSYWMQADAEIMSQFGVTFTRETQESMIGKSLWNSAAVLRQHGVSWNAAEIVSYKAERVAALYAEKGINWRPGARELLLAAKSWGIPNVLVTMALRNVAEVIANALPDGVFSAVFGGDDFPPGGGKPLPAPYLAGAQAVGAEPHECVAFEDSPTGLTSATSAACVAFGVTNVLDLSTCEAHLVLTGLATVRIVDVCDFYARLRGKPAIPGGYGLSGGTV